MLKITEEFINSIAPNQSAVINGMGLIKKNGFVNLNIAEDHSFIMGECKGSGASNYLVSADFIKPDSPVFRCTCPSRQIPCKHVIGLLYAYQNGKTFETAQIPQDILDKREKAEKRQEKQAEKKDGQVSEAPKKVNKTALKKKIAAQLEGLELLEKIITHIAQSGLGSINSKTLGMLEDQAKQLGNYYLTYPQSILREFLFLFIDCDDHEKIYSAGIDQILMLYAVCKKGKEYLEKRLVDPELSMDPGSTLEELLGHAWQLSELKDYGLMQTEVELMQLKFYSSTSQARKEYIDAGAWINLKTGQIHETLNYRPFKAAKYIREDDSFFSVMMVPELFTYPGDMNQRVRWDSSAIRDITKADYQTVKSHAYENFAEVIKAVKNQIKNPIADKFPLALLKFSHIGKVDDDFVIEDASGQRIVLVDNYMEREPPSTELLELTKQVILHNHAVLVRFHSNPDTNKLCAQPLTIVTDDEIVRLTF